MSAMANKTAFRAAVVIEIMKLSVAFVAHTSARTPLAFFKGAAGVGMGMQQLQSRGLKRGNILFMFSLGAEDKRTAGCLSVGVNP